MKDIAEWIVNLLRFSMRQGLNRVARKWAGAWPAWCGGDFRSHRKPAGPAFRPTRTTGESPSAAPKINRFRTIPKPQRLQFMEHRPSL
jgi:hypothetical protein